MAAAGVAGVILAACLGFGWLAAEIVVIVALVKGATVPPDVLDSVATGGQAMVVAMAALLGFHIGRKGES